MDISDPFEWASGLSLEQIPPCSGVEESSLGLIELGSCPLFAPFIDWPHSPYGTDLRWPGRASLDVPPSSCTPPLRREDEAFTSPAMVPSREVSTPLTPLQDSFTEQVSDDRTCTKFEEAYADFLSIDANGPADTSEDEYGLFRLARQFECDLNQSLCPSPDSLRQPFVDDSPNSPGRLAPSPDSVQPSLTPIFLSQRRDSFRDQPSALSQTIYGYTVPVFGSGLQAQVGTSTSYTTSSQGSVATVSPKDCFPVLNHSDVSAGPTTYDSLPDSFTLSQAKPRSKRETDDPVDDLATHRGPQRRRRRLDDKDKDVIIPSSPGFKHVSLYHSEPRALAPAGVVSIVCADEATKVSSSAKAIAIGTQTVPAASISPAKKPQVVSPSRPMCEYPGCGKSFSSMHNMLEHQRTHMDRRPKENRCSFPNCGKEYYYKRDLRRHEKKTHFASFHKGPKGSRRDQLATMSSRIKV